LCGREICQAAWGGVFDAFGSSTNGKEDVLIVASVGMQTNPLGSMEVPANAICSESIPQVEILKEGVSVFLTHGGQNSFTEAMHYATPVVVCPGFGDQVVNGSKALSLGVGLKVDRPVAALGDENDVAARYRIEVCRAVNHVYSDASFGDAAQRVAHRLHTTGGVGRAVELILGGQTTSKTTHDQPEADPCVGGA